MHGLLFFEPVWLLCFFKNTGSKHLINKKKKLLTVHGSTAKSRAERKKMKNIKILLLKNSTMIHCSLNSVSCHLHCSLNSGGMCPLFSEQGRHTPLFTEQWSMWTVQELHCSREIFFFFFSVLIFLIFFFKKH
jgi:hypothetical protein